MLTIRKLFYASRTSHIASTFVAHQNQSESYGTSPKILISLESKLGLPEKPKKPMPPFFIFGAKASKEISANSLKPVRMKDRLKVLGEMWKKVDKDEKAKMHKEFIEKLAKYNTEIDQYMKSLSPEDRQRWTEAKKESKELKKARMELRSTNKPTGPGNPFVMFMRDKYSKKEFHEVGLGLHTQEISDAWRNLSPAEKSIWQAKFQDARNEYEKALSDWEGQMIREGKPHLVRTKSLPTNLKPTPIPKGPRKIKPVAEASTSTSQPSAE